MFNIAPYPMSKLALQFQEEPDLEVDIDVNLEYSTGSSSLPARLKSVLYGRLKKILKEGLVVPNAEWLNLPGVSENEPPMPPVVTQVSYETSSTFIDTSDSAEESDGELKPIKEEKKLHKEDSKNMSKEKSKINLGTNIGLEIIKQKYFV